MDNELAKLAGPHRRCRVRLSAQTTYVGHIEGDNFIMDDKISNGSSWFALTHKAPNYKPIPLSEFAKNGDEIEYL